MQKKTALGKKKQKTKLKIFTSGAVSTQISRLEQLSQEKGDGWTNEGGAEIFANEGARCRPFSTLTNKAFFERRAEAQIFKEKKGNTHKDCYQENCSQGKKKEKKVQILKQTIHAVFQA